jgi:CheY-like chemotaxis protein
MPVAPARSRPLVLVADHHADTRGMLRQMLTMSGFDVVERDDGIAVLSTVEQQQPDVIVLGWTLQGLDGLAVTRRLQHADAALARRVIFVSGRAEPEAERDARAAGCDSFLVKPVNIFELLGIVRRVAAHGEPGGDERELR